MKLNRKGQTLVEYVLIISLITLILFLKFIKKKQLKNLLVIILNLNIFQRYTGESFC